MPESLPELYSIDCAGPCKKAWELSPPEETVRRGMFGAWLRLAGWTRNAFGGYICPFCSGKGGEA